MKIRKMSNYATLMELLAGILVYSIPVEIIILFVTERKLFSSVGFLAGVALAVFMTIHMAIIVEESVSRGEEGALKHVRFGYIIRIVVFLIVFLGLFFLGIGDVITALFGLISLKVSAYLRPLTHKVTQKFTDKGR
ncbi:MAG: hypothetical protein E7266_03665 [Lachnospiraceae bacterium]|nr:hypothetical protein [Lachnospiraceae bacterium]